VRTKCAQKACFGLWGQYIYDPRELPEVSTVGPGVNGGYKLSVFSGPTAHPGLPLEVFLEVGRCRRL
jgi:hypothetical protein